MIQNFIFASVMTVFVGMLLIVCVGSYLWLKSTKPAAMEPPFRAAGPRAGFDILPCPSSLVTAPPLAVSPRPHLPAYAASGTAMGRGMNLVQELSNVLHINDYRSAESVAVTIDGNRVWIDVNGKNVFRAYNIETIQLDDRRAAHASIQQG